MATANITFSVIFSGTGAGTVTSNPAGISCPGTCSASLSLSGSNPFPVTFTAVPNIGSVFVGWSITQSPSGSPLVYPLTSSNASETFNIGNVDSTYRVTAQFNIAPPVECETVTLMNDGPFNIFLNEPFGPVTLIPVGGTGPYTFSVNPDYQCPGQAPCFPATLPPGITLGATTGILQGTATALPPCQFIPITITYPAGQGSNETCTSTVCIQLSVTTRPLPQCYYLIACGGRPNVITVTNDLSLYVGQVIQILGNCYTVQIAPTCDGSITLNDPIITVFQDCCTCNPPHIYELIDCTGVNPAIFTNTNLAQYVGQTVKICDFLASPVIPIGATVATCTVPNEKGFVTQITGPTTGYYYESSSGLVKPYLNNIAFPLNIGDQLCVNPASPFNVVSFQTGNWTIQFFIDTTPITNPIVVDFYMPIPTLQWFIDQQIIYPGTTITVNTFDSFNLLNVTVNITSPVPDGQLNIDIINLTSPTYPPVTTISEDLTGACICYTVSDIGTSCDFYPPFNYVITEAFPDCVCCLPPPDAPEPPPYEPTIPEIDKHTYKVCETECDINNNKVFANAMYDQFKTDAYGMESCCPRNINQIWIAKELSDLSKIKC